MFVLIEWNGTRKAIIILILFLISWNEPKVFFYAFDANF